MQFGVTMFVTDYSIGAAEFAVAVEERGFDALFVPDHTHIPAARTPFAGGDLPPDYIRNLDMFATLTAAAAVTTRIRLRHRHLPHCRARSNHHRQAGGEPRSPFRRAGRFWDRRRLES